MVALLEFVQVDSSRTVGPCCISCVSLLEGSSLEELRPGVAEVLFAQPGSRDVISQRPIIASVVLSGRNEQSTVASQGRPIYFSYIHHTSEYRLKRDAQMSRDLACLCSLPCHELLKQRWSRFGIRMIYRGGKPVIEYCTPRAQRGSPFASRF